MGEVDFIQRLYKLSSAEKREALRNAIGRKCKFPVSSAKLDYILARINIHRAYLIKATSNPTKFLNIATAEHIDTKDRVLFSQVFPIYGRFVSGLFVKTDTKTFTPICGTLDHNNDAAAVKLTLNYQTCGTISSTYTLILYETGSFQF